MTDICEICGLPKNICVCNEMEKETQKIKIFVKRTRFNKMMTLISGFESKEKARELEKILKKKLACGGTTDGTLIELQGNHMKKVRNILLKEGFKGELIEGG